MDTQFALQNYLRENFANAKARNPRLSLRAFAKKLGIPAPALSEIMQGRRRASARYAARILAASSASPLVEANILGTGFYSGAAQPPNANARKYLELRADQFEVISSWVHFAILSLLELPRFIGEAKAIAERLGVSVREAQQAGARLERLGLVKRKGSRYLLAATETNISSSDGVPSAAVRRSHVEYLELAQASLIRDEIAARDFSGLTIRANPRQLESARQLIRDFQDRLADHLESGECTEVFRINVQVFPLTKRSGQ